jgi:hypothetical protein
MTFEAEVGNEALCLLRKAKTISSMFPLRGLITIKISDSKYRDGNIESGWSIFLTIFCNVRRVLRLHHNTPKGDPPFAHILSVAIAISLSLRSPCDLETIVRIFDFNLSVLQNILSLILLI